MPEPTADREPERPSPVTSLATPPSVPAPGDRSSSDTAPSSNEPPKTPDPLLTTRPPRAGELSLGWRVTMALGWIGVTMALAAVWNASVQIGLSTWWLGPRATPRPLPIRLAPFVAPVLMVLGTVNNIRWLGWFGLGASAVIAGIGLVDLGYVSSLAVVELITAAAGAGLSLAALSGTYRRAPHASSPDGEVRPA